MGMREVRAGEERWEGWVKNRRQREGGMGKMDKG